MGFIELLLKPFNKWFLPPVVNTPFSTIKLPPAFVTILLFFVSFFVICSGTIFCYVRGMPMVGGVRTNDGRVVPSWIDVGNISNQFLAEGMVASFMFTVAALSIITGIIVIQIKGELSDFQYFLKLFAYSAPFWCFCSFSIFNAKFQSFFPSFFPH